MTILGFYCLLLGLVFSLILAVMVVSFSDGWGSIAGEEYRFYVPLIVDTATLFTGAFLVRRGLRFPPGQPNAFAAILLVFGCAFATLVLFSLFAGIVVEKVQIPGLVELEHTLYASAALAGGSLLTAVGYLSRKSGDRTP